jgi:hypothetical protein
MSRHFEYYPAYQFVNRGSIRDFNNTNPYLIVTADKAQADYICETMGLNPPEWARTGGVQSDPSLLDISAGKRGRKKVERTPEEIEAQAARKRASDAARAARYRERKKTGRLEAQRM